MATKKGMFNRIKKLIRRMKIHIEDEDVLEMLFDKALQLEHQIRFAGYGNEFDELIDSEFVPQKWM